MEKKIVCILVLICSITYGQEKSFFNEIVYNQTINILGNKSDKDFKLIFNNDFSFYEEMNYSEKDIYTNEGKGSQVMMLPKDNEQEFYYTINKSNLVYCNIIVANKHLLIVDDEIKINWELVDETKKIANYNCQKAKCNFRGRDYVVWFTSEIPVNFGPWKLKGLGGAILEGYEVTYKIHFLAKEIKLNIKLKDEEKKINSIKLENAIPIKNSKDEILHIRKDFLSKLNSQLPQGVKPFAVDSNCKDCGESLEIF